VLNQGTAQKCSCRRAATRKFSTKRKEPSYRFRLSAHAHLSTQNLLVLSIRYSDPDPDGRREGVCRVRVDEHFQWRRPAAEVDTRAECTRWQLAGTAVQLRDGCQLLVHAAWASAATNQFGLTISVSPFQIYIKTFFRTEAS
jgi:hypothetical protein